MKLYASIKPDQCLRVYSWNGRSLVISAAFYGQNMEN